MMSESVLNPIACAGVCLLAAAAGAQPLGVNLVVNGDAESGTIAGWIDGGIEARQSMARAQEKGPPPRAAL